MPMLAIAPTRWRALGCFSLLLVGFTIPFETARAQQLKWQPIPPLEPPDNPTLEESGATTPSWQPKPETQSETTSPVWHILDQKEGSVSIDSQFPQWVVLGPDEVQQLEQTLDTTVTEEPAFKPLTPEQWARARFRGPKPASFHSVSRNITYGDTLYPEMGFWIPSVFRQSVDYRFTFAYQLLGNPTNTGFRDWCDWEDFWDACSDGQYFAEVTPLIWGPASLGINFSQQESFVGDRADGDFEQGGQAIGFQLKANVSNNIGFGILGQNLYNPFGRGGPNGSYPAPGEEIQADLGRGYLWLGSAAWDLGFWFGSDTPAVLAVSAGIGNGRYKSIDDTQQYWVNYGPYGPIGTVGLALNEHLSIFAEYAGQYNGFGVSYKPFKQVPITGTLMFRDFQGTYTGKVNCKDGNPDNCRTTVDGRITISG